jgi:hypothetical protein
MRRLTQALGYGIFCRMGDMRKITAYLPVDLLAKAQDLTGEGITETLRFALEQMAHAAWCGRMLELEGKVDIDIDLAALREDRDFDPVGGRAP